MKILFCNVLKFIVIFVVYPNYSVTLLKSDKQLVIRNVLYYIISINSFVIIQYILSIAITIILFNINQMQ